MLSASPVGVFLPGTNQPPAFCFRLVGSLTGAKKIKVFSTRLGSHAFWIVSSSLLACLFVTARPWRSHGLFSFGHWPKCFWNDRKKFSHSGRNVWKYRLMNTVTASFDTIVTAETSQRKKQATGVYSGGQFPQNFVVPRKFCFKQQAERRSSRRVFEWLLRCHGNPKTPPLTAVLESETVHLWSCVKDCGLGKRFVVGSHKARLYRAGRLASHSLSSCFRCAICRPTDLLYCKQIRFQCLFNCGSPLALCTSFATCRGSDF